jgi:hypothetical protein
MTNTLFGNKTWIDYLLAMANLFIIHIQQDQIACYPRQCCTTREDHPNVLVFEGLYLSENYLIVLGSYLRVIELATNFFM